ncbi:hypothetical protein HO133_001473 [Letharia lupina]|uniref:Uncharacterized protein n=1 Tax=Letharia lupina TaxID=560253 RepID=A0A8H6CF64_9LECA|nr:uncharacterized protein HO133_001473 [Letharia lupina]KAF6222387.1 hypothetical protein HO133_001473 [Letharia lupina]
MIDQRRNSARLNVSHRIHGCRDVARGEKAKSTILASTLHSSTPPKIEVWPIDMANYSSVRAFGDRACSTLSRLDAVVLDAGVSLDKFELARGIESTLTINVISTFLLAQLVLPKLSETGRAQATDTHLTFVGSMTHIFAKTKQLCDAKSGDILRTLSDPAQVDMASRYLLSKLLVILGSQDLATKTNTSAKVNGTVVNCVNPGWYKTALFRHEDLGIEGRFALRIMGRTGEEGSRTLVHASSADNLTNGKYLSECQVKPEPQFVRSEVGQHVQERIANELRKVLEQIQLARKSRLDL